MKLRPLLLATGTVSVEGGDTSARTEESSIGGKHQRLVISRSLTPDRKAANTISTTAMRDLRKLTLVTTPWGRLIPVERSGELEALLGQISKRVAEFNAHAKTAQLVNAVLWEVLAGPKRALIEGWIKKRSLPAPKLAELCAQAVA